MGTPNGFSRLKPLRILVPLNSFAPGGVERVALRLCRSWIAEGVDVRLVMGRDAGAMRPEADGLEFETLRPGHDAAARWDALSMIFKLPAIIRRTQPDVIFCAGNTYSIVAVAMKLRFGRRCAPVVAKISNDLARADLPQPVRWGYHRWLRIQGRFIDHFTGMAPPMQAEIEQAIGIASERVSIIDDPALAQADLDRLARCARVPGPGTHFVAVGRLAPQKNLPMLLRAFARIARGDDRLTIAGEGAERPRLEREIARLGLGGRVALPGHLADPASVLCTADVFALSSSFEGVPAVVAEALAAGAAIVATDCSVSMADMLDHGRLGTLVPVGDEDGFAAALDEARAATPDRAAMREQAARFTAERSARKYLALFTRIAASRARA